MLLNFYTTKPIFIVSTPRSGSNIFLELVKKEFPGIKTFSEPDTSAGIMSGLVNAIEINRQFITKIHILHLARKCSDTMLHYDSHVKEFLLSDKTFKVAIKRKDIISQIVSRYIAVSRDTWFYSDERARDNANNNIGISTCLMQTCIDVTLENVSLMQNTAVDMEYYYEDIIAKFNNDVPSTYNLRSPKPANYQLIVDLAIDLLARCDVPKQFRVNDFNVSLPLI